MPIGVSQGKVLINDEKMDILSYANSNRFRK
jgi:hypothetical protein